MKADILCRYSSKHEWQCSYISVGTKAEIIKSAEGLLRSVREDEGFPRAQVVVQFESGREIRIRYSPHA